MVTFRKKRYSDLETLQTDLDNWLHYYNNERAHLGYREKCAVVEHQWKHCLMENGTGKKKI
ncbi:hypothetical protein A9G41_06795 [Gilliamella sp. Nev5-1]|nr:hypothetical protein A9G40_13790 [Gilliamella apicola]OCG65839.1 hypothetical protein A9G30_06620 [Gilliamella apicola]OCG69131.1 hypothetical protein A9G41_06795 [Gilliamella apicola]